MSTNAASLRTRLAKKADAEQITTLINVAFRRAEDFFIDEDRIDLATVLGSLENGEFLLLELNNSLAGCVYLEQRGERTYLGLLSVEPSVQQAGVGSQLLAAAEEHCRARTSRFIDILTVNLRTELLSFYRKRGYVETGTSPFPTDVPTKLPCHFINMSKAL